MSHKKTDHLKKERVTTLKSILFLIRSSNWVIFSVSHSPCYWDWLSLRNPIPGMSEIKINDIISIIRARDWPLEIRTSFSLNIFPLFFLLWDEPLSLPILGYVHHEFVTLLVLVFTVITRLLSSEETDR